MATHIVLANLTDKGLKNIQASPDRFNAFQTMAEKHGVTVEGAHYTVGHYDVVVTLSGSDEAVTAVLLSLGALGNVRTETLKAYPVDEMKKIIGKVS